MSERMRSAAEVLVFGSIHLDLRLSVRQLPAPGETVLAHRSQQALGGKGANQAVVLAGLGVGSALCGAVGDDPAAAFLLSELARHGVGLDMVETREGASGTAVVVVQEDGENLICVSPGSSGEAAWTPKARSWLSERPGSALMLQQEVSVRANIEAAGDAVALGRPVVYNAAPVPEVDHDLLTLLKRVRVLVVNEHEARDLLTGAGAQVSPGRLDHDDLERLRALGPGSVVVTQGACGALALDGLEAIQVDAFKVDTLDTAGAGDAFCAQLTAALASGATLRDAVRLACACGALATRRPGLTAPPSRDEVLRLVTTDL